MVFIIYVNTQRKGAEGAKDAKEKQNAFIREIRGKSMAGGSADAHCNDQHTSS
jgi:hypothetical protein